MQTRSYPLASLLHGVNASAGLAEELESVPAAALAPTPSWLEQRGRMLFGMERRIGDIAPEAAWHAGSNIHAGAANAGYPCFAGGCFNW